jgi:hypothetical protein
MSWLLDPDPHCRECKKGLFLQIFMVSRFLDLDLHCSKCKMRLYLAFSWLLDRIVIPDPDPVAPNHADPEH